MYNISEEYKNDIYSPIRKNNARITFDITDVTVNEDDKSITTTEEFIISNKEQINNSIRENSYNIITCENNRLKLDGSFTFADDNILKNDEVGWVSKALCNEYGVFKEQQVITITFSEKHSLIGVTITFDKLNNEYAEEFEIKAYDVNNYLINNINITNNTEAQREIIVKFQDLVRIEVYIKKWNKGYRRARVSEIDWGFIRVYDDNSLIKFNFIEEVDILSGEVPSSEFRFTVDNAEGLFNILNPSGFYKFLQEKQRVKAEVGTLLSNGKIEYIPIGNFLLKTWESEEDDLTATFTCNTILDLMDNFNFENLIPKVNYSFYNLFEELFNICSIRKYEIDSKLKDIKTNCLIEKQSCKDALKMALIAGMSNIFITKDNKIIIKQDLKIAADSYISLENMYKVPKVDLEEAIKTVEVTYFNTLEDKLTISLVNYNLKLGGSIKVESNTLIDTENRAIEVANWLMDRSKLRNKYTLNWRGNPSLELLDYIDIANTYNEEIKAHITKTELDYQGYLKGKTELIGGIK